MLVRGIGIRDISLIEKVSNKLKSQGIAYDTVYTDKWDSFNTVFQEDSHVIGKENTKGIDGNNSRLRHTIRRAFRKTCCFLKKLFNHLKAFGII